MSFPSWIHSRRSTGKASRRGERAARRCHQNSRLLLEGLEDRRLMAFNVLAEYATGPFPQDVDLVQIDAGSQPDLVVVNSNGSVSVRLGNADGTFGGPHDSATGTNPRSAVAGDFTGDGVPDVVTANSGDLSLLVGNGDGSFQGPQAISLPGQFPPGYGEDAPLAQNPRSVATGDLNGDGKLDLVVASDTFFSTYGGGYYGYYYSDGYVNVLLGNGGGGFAAPAVHHLGTYRLPGAAAVEDINGDGKPDVITANGTDLSVLLGDGTGALGTPSHSGAGYGLSSVSLGDVDGDGKLDTVMRGFAGGLTVQKGQGDGTFVPAADAIAGSYLHSAVMGDVNADGKLDLVGVDSLFTCTSYGYYYGCYDGSSARQAHVVLGNGQGGFSLPITSSLGTGGSFSFLGALDLADLTGDGLPELAAIDAYSNVAIIAGNDGNWASPVALSISDVTVNEGDTGTVDATFIVSVVGNHDSTVTVEFSTADYDAIAGSDYTATSGTLSFAPGVFSQTITVEVLGDHLNEANEQFFVNLSNPTGGNLVDGQGVGTIVDDDTPPLISISDASEVEGNSGTRLMTFMLTLSQASGEGVWVNFTTANGTATSRNGDYVAKSGTVYFAPGETTKEITIEINGDTKPEKDERFYVNLSGAIGGEIVDSRGVGTILNDDVRGKGNGKGKSATSAARAVAVDALMSRTSKWK